jgi:hypothetical protein
MPTILNETEDEVDYTMEEGTKPPIIRGTLVACKLSPQEALQVNSAILPKIISHSFTAKSGEVVRIEGVPSEKDVKLSQRHYCEVG